MITPSVVWAWYCCLCFFPLLLPQSVATTLLLVSCIHWGYLSVMIHCILIPSWNTCLCILVCCLRCLMSASPVGIIIGKLMVIICSVTLLTCWCSGSILLSWVACCIIKMPILIGCAKWVVSFSCWMGGVLTYCGWAYSKVTCKLYGSFICFFCAIMNKVKFLFYFCCLDKNRLKYNSLLLPDSLIYEFIVILAFLAHLSTTSISNYIVLCWVKKDIFLLLVELI